MASPLRLFTVMKGAGAIATILILEEILISLRCHHSTPAAAAVETVSGVAADADQKILQEWIPVFGREEAAAQPAGIYALRPFFATANHHHGLKRPDVRPVREGVCARYTQITSRHVLTELKPVWPICFPSRWDRSQLEGMERPSDWMSVKENPPSPRSEISPERRFLWPWCIDLCVFAGEELRP